MLNKGDTCYVRLQGKVRKVSYVRSANFFSKSHWVSDEEYGHLFTTSDPLSLYECRFVCMSGVRKEYVESLS